MTKEEVIKMLEYVKHVGNGESEYKNDAQAIAIDMAIKALEQETVSRESYEHEYFLRKELDFKVARLEKQIAEQEPCEDCISRQEAINKMQELEDEDIKAYGCEIPEGFDGKRAIEALKNLPSVQPKTDVLDKIRAEIEQKPYGIVKDSVIRGMKYERADILEIIDKYKSESEK